MQKIIAISIVSIASILACPLSIHASPNDLVEGVKNDSMNCVFAQTLSKDKLKRGELAFEVTNSCDHFIEVSVATNVLTSRVDRDVNLETQVLEPYSSTRYEASIHRPSDFDSRSQSGEVYVSIEGRNLEESHASSGTSLRFTYSAHAPVLDPVKRTSSSAYQPSLRNDSVSSFGDDRGSDAIARDFANPPRPNTFGEDIPLDFQDALIWRGDSFDNHVLPRSELRSKPGARICFKIKTRYTDGGVGETSWTKRSLYARRAIGNLVFVKHKGEYKFSGVLDEDGCTQRFDVPNDAWVQIDVLSAGYVAKWMIKSWDLDSDEIPRNQLAMSIPDRNKTYRRTLTYSNSRNVYMAIARAILRNPVSYHESDHHINARSGDCSRTGYFRGSKTIQICNQQAKDSAQQNHITKKFTIVHELGHFVNHFYEGLLVGGYTDHDPPNKNFCDVVDDDMKLEQPNGDGRGSSHATTSVEVMPVAIKEGFASFFAAEAFNNPRSKYSPCDINIGRFGHHYCGGKKGDKYHPMKVMETNCDPDDGLGNETDWVRTFWDFRRSSSKVSMKMIISMLYQLRQFQLTDEDSVNDELYDKSVEIMRKLKQSKRWKRAAQANGVDW